MTKQMKRWQLVLVLVLGVLIGGSSMAAAVAGRATWVPPGDTVVRVTGDAANGFGIHHYDGSELFPPTDSEALAECLEYDRYVERERCKVEVLTWYRDLAVLKRAINWAHYVERNQV